MAPPADWKGPEGPDSLISVRSFVERIMDERDRLYDTRFKAIEIATSTAFNASEKATQAALAASEKAVHAAFAAAEKAVLKAEEAQKEYNIRSNEFRGQLDDQAKTLMPRPESQAMFKNYEDKLAVLKADMDTRFELMRKDVVNLQQSRSGAEGKSIGMDKSWGVILGIGALLVALITIGMFIISLR